MSIFLVSAAGSVSISGYSQDTEQARCGRVVSCRILEREIATAQSELESLSLCSNTQIYHRSLSLPASEASPRYQRNGPFTLIVSEDPQALGCQLASSSTTWSAVLWHLAASDGQFISLPIPRRPDQRGSALSTQPHAIQWQSPPGLIMTMDDGALPLPERTHEQEDRNQE